MGMPNQVHEAARQIIESASDIHGALALCGRQDLMGPVLNIQKKAACIIRLERGQVDITASCRQDMLNAIGCLGHVISRNIDDMQNMDGEEIVTIIRMSEVLARRGHAWLDRLAMEETDVQSVGDRIEFCHQNEKMKTTEGDDDAA